MTHRLLVLGCSATKRADAGELPALDRYDGPMWRTLRARLAELPAARAAIDAGELVLVALSAEHGFIDARTPIADYDRRMSWTRAAELEHHDTAATFRKLCDQADRVFVCAGIDYRHAARTVAPELGGSCFTDAPGIGFQRAELSAWLRDAYQGA